MFVNRAPPPVNLVLQHWCKALQSLYCTIRRLFVLFVAYSRTIRTIRGLFVLFVDYSRTIRTIRRLFALFVDYSLHYSSFINYRQQNTKNSKILKIIFWTQAGIISIAILECKKISNVAHRHSALSVTRLSQRLLPNVVLKFYKIGFFLTNTCKFGVLKFLAACSHCSHVLHPFWPFSWRQHNETVK
jgi:hypothetical protein